MKFLIPILILLAGSTASAQLTAPTITATAKGPDQINLTWAAAATPGYGYLVEIQSAGDSRYGSFTQLQIIPNGTGFTHSGGNSCTIDDPTGAYVYNPALLGSSAYLYGLPTWVVESNYVDPQDSTAAQFIAWGLKPNVLYSFRVRTYNPSSFSSYSNTATATTSNYTQRFVNTATGNDANGGTNSGADAWKTIDHAATTVTAGTVVLVEAGTYASDQIWPSNTGGASTKIVFEADTGANVILSYPPLQGAGTQTSIITHPHIVIDGINFVSGVSGDWTVYLESSFDVLANLSIGSVLTTLPSNLNNIDLQGSTSPLIYQVYSHDAGYPCAAQNPSGDNGWVISANPDNGGVFAFNHFTRGAHDTGLCKGVDAGHLCHNELWLNNVMDGGYGMMWEDVSYGQGNLFEGNFGFYPGQLEAGIYKPGMEISGRDTTVRRNIIYKPKSYGLEISSLNNLDIPNFKAYNNIWYNSADSLCFWKNALNAGTTTGLVANNICTVTSGYFSANSGTLAQSYVTDITDSITHNDFIYMNSGVPSPSTANNLWNQTSGGSCSGSPCTVSTLDSLVSPPWSENASLAVNPKFGNTAFYDFHLLSSSTLIGVGAAVTDSTYGSFSAGGNLGAFDASFTSKLGSVISSNVKITPGVKIQ